VNRQSHARPETSPPGGLVALLSRWETHGGQWQVLAETEEWLTVGLVRCDGGEEMGRVTGTRTAELTAYLGGRTTSSA
jgi:hypothetical protein